MIKYTLTLLIAAFALSFLFAPTPSLGIDLGGDMIKQAGEKAGYDKNTDEFSLSENIGRVVNIILSITGVLFTVLMVYGGYLWMTARGKDEQIEKAKSVITAAIIGIIITLGAYSISAFIVPRMLAASTA
ncbi:hypothetical protein HOF40_03415 [Candidatus Parcubacteria bacterium]|jgi:hypothetical protein|nr:hypothetical protein [Candidatus Parcubacteria bacterium]MBT3949111.1 hypothetical protein [Candidatus Parcubacteria bacterium]